MNNKEKLWLTKSSNISDYLGNMGVQGLVGGGIGAALHVLKQAIMHKKKYQKLEAANEWSKDLVGQNFIPDFKPDWGATAPWAAAGGGIGAASGAFDSYMEDRLAAKERRNREEEESA